MSSLVFSGCIPEAHPEAELEAKSLVFSGCIPEAEPQAKSLIFSRRILEIELQISKLILSIDLYEEFLMRKSDKAKLVDSLTSIHDQVTRLRNC